VLNVHVFKKLHEGLDVGTDFMNIDRPGVVLVYLDVGGLDFSCNVKQSSAAA